MDQKKLPKHEEEQIINLCQQGHNANFVKLYDAYFEPIYRFIYYKTMHQETAEDLTSQTFFKALNKIKTFSNKQGSFSSWLYQIARHNVIDHYRSTPVTADLETVWDISDGEALDLQVDDRITLDKVKSYLQKIDSLPRQILIMRLWDNLSYSEIAEITGQTETNCRQLFCRSLQKIKQNVIISLSLIIISSLLIWSQL